MAAWAKSWNGGVGNTLKFQADMLSAGAGSNVVIQTYQAEHGGMVFVSTLTQRQKRVRSRIMAMVVIAAIGASAGTVQAFNARTHADPARTWTP